MTDVTRILSQIESGDTAAADQLLPLVYDELRRLASARLAHEQPGQTLQATALAMRDVPRAKELIDRFYETAKSDPEKKFLTYLIDMRRNNPTEPLEPAGEKTRPLERAASGFWESVRLLELDRPAESRVEYDRACQLLDEARQKVVGPQWWSIVAVEILAREIERRLQISPPDPSPREGRQ